MCGFFPVGTLSRKGERHFWWTATRRSCSVVIFCHPSVSATAHPWIQTSSASEGRTPFTALPVLSSLLPHGPGHPHLPPRLWPLPFLAFTCDPSTHQLHGSWSDLLKNVNKVTSDFTTHPLFCSLFCDLFLAQELCACVLPPLSLHWTHFFASLRPYIHIFINYYIVSV